MVNAENGAKLRNNLPVERKGENEIRVERVFKMFINRWNREGYDTGSRWLHWMHTYLSVNERGI